ncbi:MAG: BspA family leucine-rich repeat surface protein [Lachnospiraceae bacterium]
MMKRKVLAGLLLLSITVSSFSTVGSMPVNAAEYEDIPVATTEETVTGEVATQEQLDEDLLGGLSEEKLNDEAEENNISKGTIVESGNYGTWSWSLDADGMLLVAGEITKIDAGWPWNYCKGDIVSAKVTGSGSGDMSWMFDCWSSLTSLDVSEFDTSNVTDMHYMFYNCDSLQSLDLSGFVTTNVTDMSDMFIGCSGLINLNVSGFDTSNVTDMSGMFYDCSGLTGLDLKGFDTSNVTNMGGMFSGCSGLQSLDVTGFDTSNVTNMGGMFSGCSGLQSLDVTGFDTSNISNMSFMFESCSGLTNLNVGGFDTSNVTAMWRMFSGCRGLQGLDVTGFDTSNVSNMSGMFESCGGLTNLNVSGFDTSNVVDMSFMFDGCSGLTSLNVSNFDTSKVTNMSSMFGFCGGLKELNLEKIETGNVTDMTDMFSFCSSLTGLNIKDFDTSNVTNMKGMFSACSGLQSLDVTGFDTSNVTNMGGMFSGCSGLQSLDVTGFDTSNVTNMGSMFDECSSLKSLILDSITTGSVTRMEGMFYNCKSLIQLDLSNFDTEKVTNMDYMFGNCNLLKEIKSPYNISVEVTFPSGSVWSDEDGTTVTSMHQNRTESVTYTRTDVPAIFIDYYLDGGINSIDNPNSYVGETITLSNPTKSGYIFSGWYNDADFSKKITEITSSNAMDLVCNGMICLYAKWTANNYILKLDGNGASGSMSDIEDCSVNSTYILPANEYVRKGYLFTGWNTKADGSGDAYADKAEVNNLTTEIGSVVTLYAQWKPITYKVAFNANGGTGTMSALTGRTYGVAFNLTKNTFKRVGYTFLAWNTKKDGSGVYIKDKLAVKNLTSVNGKTVTLYACWKKVTVGQVATPVLSNPAAGKLLVAYKPVNGAQGYMIQFATNSSMRNSKTVVLTENKKMISGLVKGKTYYVRVVAFKMDSTGKKVYGKFSPIEKKKIFR